MLRANVATTTLDYSVCPTQIRKHIQTDTRTQIKSESDPRLSNNKNANRRNENIIRAPLR